jgi:senataxin
MLALRAALEKQPITLIQGPPGTGKTRIVLSLLSVILHARPSHGARRGGVHATRDDADAGAAADAKAGDEKASLSSMKRLLRDLRPNEDVVAAAGAPARRRLAPWLFGGFANPRDAAPLPRGAALPAPSPPERPELLGEDGYRRAKVLVCAPSNSALDEITLRIMQSGLLGPTGEAYSPTLVRVGVNAHRSVERVSMDALVRERLGKEEEEMRAPGFGRGRRGGGGGGGADERAVSASRTNAPTPNAGAPLPAEKKFERALAKDRLKLAILDEARVVCSTLSFSGSGMFSRMTKPFDVVVVDEAAQAVEPSVLVPLCYGAKQVFLVGDPRQLPATVLSALATKKMYNQSLFKRLERCGYPVHVLATQYRMHPEIRAFPSRQFYDDRLVDAPRMAARTKRPWHRCALFRPFVFVDVHQGREYRPSGPDGASWANEEEAEACVAIVKALVRGYDELSSGENVGVISPYKAQASAIRRRLADALGADLAAAIDVNSIDGFQGREKDVCVFSVVRAPGSRGDDATRRGGYARGLGFVADERRINVGLTRARSSLIVLGSAEKLKRDENWGALVRSAKERNAVIRPPRGKRFETFVSNMVTTYDADDLSGSEEEEEEEEEEAVGDDAGATAAMRAHEPEWASLKKAGGGYRTTASRDEPGASGSNPAGSRGLGFSAEGARDEFVSEVLGGRRAGDDYERGDDAEADEDPFAQDVAETAAGEKRGGAKRRTTAGTAKRSPPAKRARGGTKAK